MAERIELVVARELVDEIAALNRENAELRTKVAELRLENGVLRTRVCNDLG